LHECFFAADGIARVFSSFFHCGLRGGLGTRHTGRCDAHRSYRCRGGTRDLPENGLHRDLAKATYVNSYRGGPLLYTNPPGVSLNRLELKKQMRYFFAQRFSASYKKMFWGKSLA
jgi:hypothetical protein